MTIGSHPWTKLIVAVVAACLVSIVFDSWFWGIPAFFGVMSVFIFIASWIFGDRPTKGKVELDDELKGLLNKLKIIGAAKNDLPLQARGWCNSLGLYVELRNRRGMTRLQAGERRQYQIDAWEDHHGGGSGWIVKRYEPGDWQKLVDPTLEMTNWLGECGELPEEKVRSLNEAIRMFKKEGKLRLPSCRDDSASSAPE